MGSSRLLSMFAAASFHFKANGSTSNKTSGKTAGIKLFHSCLQSYRDVFDIAGWGCVQVLLRMSSFTKKSIRLDKVRQEAMLSASPNLYHVPGSVALNNAGVFLSVW